MLRGMTDDPHGLIRDDVNSYLTDDEGRTTSHAPSVYVRRFYPSSPVIAPGTYTLASVVEFLAVPGRQVEVPDHQVEELERALTEAGRDDIERTERVTTTYVVGRRARTPR